MLLTLYTIGVYMDREGYAFPSQQLIAAGARASVRTVQRHIAQAERDGWLGIQVAGRGGKGWRHYVYRAAVPDDVQLEDMDETISDHITAQDGGILPPHRADTIVSPPTSHRDDKIVSPPNGERHPESMALAMHRGDNGSAKVATTGAKVATNDPHRGDTGDAKVATQLCRTNSCSETPASRTPASITRASEEAHNARSRVESARAADDEQERLKAEKLKRMALMDRIEHLCFEYDLAGFPLKTTELESVERLESRTKASRQDVLIAIRLLTDEGRLPIKRRRKSGQQDVVV